MRVLACDVILKIVSLFLVAMAVLAMFGRLRFPGQKKLNSARCRPVDVSKLAEAPVTVDEEVQKHDALAVFCPRPGDPVTGR